MVTDHRGRVIVTRPIKVLVVSHDASRTGAPLVLLSAVRHLAERGAVQPRFLLLRGGPLSADFSRIGPTVGLNRAHGRSGGAAVEVGLQELALDKSAQRVRKLRIRRLLRTLAENWSPDLVWLNSAGSLEVLSVLPVATPAVAFIHELGDGLDRSRPIDLEPGLARCRVVQVPSNAVASELQRRGIDSYKTVVRRPICSDTATRFESLDGEICRSKLGLSPGALVVGASGGSVWRKGGDMLAPVARQVTAKAKAHFLWWGLDLESERVDELRRDLRRCGMQACVTLLPSTGRPEHLLGACDVFWSPAREDPFPLTLGEAAIARVAIVASDAGGAAEFLGHGDDRGRLVRVLDVGAAAGAITDLLTTPHHRAKLVAAASRYVGDNLTFSHFVRDCFADLQAAAVNGVG